MPRKNISLVGIPLPHPVKWRWEERGDSGNFCPPSKVVPSWSCSSSFQRVTAGTTRCSFSHPSSSDCDQSEMQNPSPAYCRVSADPEACGEGWKKMIRTRLWIFWALCGDSFSRPRTAEVHDSSVDVQVWGRSGRQRRACSAAADLQRELWAYAPWPP